MESRDFKLRSFIRNQLPGFVREDHSLFVSFLEAYYEWLESKSEFPRTPAQLDGINDIDKSVDLFLEEFQKTYLATFPIDLILENQRGEKISPKKLMKNIKQFYSAKGIKSSFKFIFRVLYSSNIEIYYPKEKILKLSDGVWITQRKMYLETDSLLNCNNLRGTRISQREIPFDPTSNLKAEAKIDNAVSYRKNNKIILELEVSEIVGNFVVNKLAFSESSTKNLGKVLSVLIDIQVDPNNRGEDYEIGDTVFFSEKESFQEEDSSLPSAKISRISPRDGGVVEIRITDPGYNINEENCELSDPPTRELTVNKEGNRFNANLFFGPIFEKNEFYVGTKGTLSSDMVLQDNFKYQDYSYVIRSDISLSKYRDQVKGLLHPAGVNLLAETLIRRCFVAEPSKFLNIPQRRIRRIGNFLPYTFLTFDNLGEWMNGECYDPEIHDQLVICGTSDCVTGNPISSGFGVAPQGVTCTTADILNISSTTGDYWATFNHPNRTTRRVFGNIRPEEILDFYGPTQDSSGVLLPQGPTGWQEWNFVGDSQTREEQQIDWLTGFLNNNIAVATLDITDFSEFRKIPIYSFFEELRCDYDCRFTNLCLDPDVEKTPRPPKPTTETILTTDPASIGFRRGFPRPTSPTITTNK